MLIIVNKGLISAPYCAFALQTDETRLPVQATIPRSDRGLAALPRPTTTFCKGISAAAYDPCVKQMTSQ